MASRGAHIDRFFFWSVIALTTAGFVIFLSASLGLLAQNGTSFGTIALKQAISLVLGIIIFLLFSKLKYQWLRKGALFILIGAIAINLLLFIPALALRVNGAARWISLGIVSFQPSELLKIAFIVYIAAWCYFAKDRLKTMKYGLFPYLVVTGILSALLLAQRDTDTLLIIAGTGLLMMFVAGMPVRHAALALGCLAVVVLGVIMLRPYAMQRVKTYLDHSGDAQGASYQINQAQIAIGSGRWTGRGFGQSVQKFGYLPQPTDDSIFAVAGEEFGFVGSVALLLLYLMFAASAIRVGNKSPDAFGGLIAIGIAVLVIAESFLNMGAMLGLVPLSGIPLLFVSHGGTALIISLMAAGIVANVSKHAKG